MIGRRALVIGWRGGVGQALLHLLATHTRGRPILERLDALVVVDRDAGPSSPAVPGVQVLDPAAAVDPEALARTLRDHAIDHVIEVADVDTRATSAVCAAAGVHYVSASLQGAGPTMIAAGRLLVERPDTRGASHLIGAGMNPGIVNALAVAGIDELARRVRVPAARLGVAAIHVTEQDTTASADHREPDVFAMSWSPRHALDEILEPHAMYVADGRLARLDHRPHEARYAARCGERVIAGMIVPHEELVSIGARYPGIESAFFYAIPDAAQAALRRHPDRAPDAWQTRRLYAPHTDHLVGHDRVGVAIATRRFGELWLGFEHSASVRAAGNGTLLQAAAGVLAGWTLLGTRRGVHVVDELDIDAYLAIVEAVLGPRTIYHAPDARFCALRDRRLDDDQIATPGIAIGASGDACLPRPR